MDGVGRDAAGNLVGLLMKKGSGGGMFGSRAWNSRYFVLAESVLYWYEKESDAMGDKKRVGKEGRIFKFDANLEIIHRSDPKYQASIITELYNAISTNQIGC